ncbi:hypothetical protein MYOV011v1_p0001 [Vibrio phage 6E35.1a]|nr:hypothetical protein MYOV011v1_p0001 [Vibrio phage 6E35.1a]
MREYHYDMSMNVCHKCLNNIASYRNMQYNELRNVCWLDD